MFVAGHPFRLTADDYRGGKRYFLTICTHRRRRYFGSTEVVEAVRLQFFHTSTIEPFAILAYCVMPDHIHAVVEGQAMTANLTRFVRLAKQRSGFRFVRQTGQRLWQESYFDRTLRRDEDLADVVRYVINNPVRAGLVDAPTEYPFWGSALCSREELLEFVSVESRPRV